MVFWGVLGFLLKAYSLGFLLEDRREGRQLPYGGFDVCPDKTYLNKLVPFWQVVSAERRDGWLGRAGSQSGKTKQIGGLV